MSDPTTEDTVPEKTAAEDSTEKESASSEPKGEKRAAADETDDGKEKSPPKKAKIAMPPPVAENIMNVEKYKLDEGPPAESSSKESEDDIAKKITSPCLILFGLHPLIREPPLRKMCEDYGKVVDLTVRSAFANRYGHVEFETVEEARGCYKALNGAKLLHKAIMVQPSKPQKKEQTTETKDSSTSASKDQAVEAN